MDIAQSISSAAEGFTWDGFLNTVWGWITNTGVKIIIALVILFVSFRVINVLSRKLEKKMVGGKKKVDKTLATTLLYLMKLALKVVIVVSLVGYLGIDTSGITALITSLGVCVGLAVNGAASNFAGGVLILITRPFRVDDFIEACGHSGTVEDIHLINTRLRTGDNKVVYIPNGTLSTSTIINYSEKDKRRIDVTFTVAYESDYDLAKATISEIFESHELILKEEGKNPYVGISAHGASGIDIATRVWVKSGDFLTVKSDILEKVKKSFDEKGIEIPYNKLDVNLKNS